MYVIHYSVGSDFGCCGRAFDESVDEDVSITTSMTTGGISAGFLTEDVTTSTVAFSIFFVVDVDVLVFSG